jgi:hypothetical protein
MGSGLGLESRSSRGTALPGFHVRDVIYESASSMRADGPVDHDVTLSGTTRMHGINVIYGENITHES